MSKSCRVHSPGISTTAITSRSVSVTRVPPIALSTDIPLCWIHRSASVQNRSNGQKTECFFMEAPLLLRHSESLDHKKPSDASGGPIKVVKPVVTETVAAPAPGAEPEEEAQHDQQDDHGHNPFPAELSDKAVGAQLTHRYLSSLTENGSLQFMRGVCGRSWTPDPLRAHFSSLDAVENQPIRWDRKQGAHPAQKEGFP